MSRGAALAGCGPTLLSLPCTCNLTLHVHVLRGRRGQGRLERLVGALARRSTVSGSYIFYRVVWLRAHGC